MFMPCPLKVIACETIGPVSVQMLSRVTHVCRLYGKLFKDSVRITLIATLIADLKTAQPNRAIGVLG